MLHNYVISRLDQDPKQIVLQAIHAAFVCRAVPDEDALVFLVAKNEAELIEIANKLEDDLAPYRYCERENEDDETSRQVLNAVAFRGVHPEQRKYFRKFEKWDLPSAVVELAA